jgi:hypothetical protein
MKVGKLDQVLSSSEQLTYSMDRYIPSGEAENPSAGSEIPDG